MQITITDERGRITLGKKIQKRYGRKFMILEANDEIILKPVVKEDPIKGLAELGQKSGINKYSIKQLKKIAEEEALREAVSNQH